MSEPAPQPLFDTLDHMPKFSESNLSNALPYPDDFRHAYEFIYSYRGSQATFNAYRREMERFLQWCWFVNGTSFNCLRRSDIETYIEFCQKPPQHWVGKKNVSRFINEQGKRVPNPAWRPFVMLQKTGSPKKNTNSSYTLSQKALQAIFAILGSFYNYLITEEYAPYNPVAQIRQKSKFLRKHQSKAEIRRLSDRQWRYVITIAEQLANTDPDKHERTLFIMNALFGMYLRISELVASDRWEPQMGHFFKDSEDAWWFKTVGKCVRGVCVFFRGACFFEA